MTTYKIKHSTIDATQFTEARAAELRAAHDAGTNTAPYVVRDQGGYAVDIGSTTVRLSFGDYVELDAEGKPCGVRSAADFEAVYDTSPAVDVAGPLPAQPADTLRGRAVDVDLVDEAANVGNALNAVGEVVPVQAATVPIQPPAPEIETAATEVTPAT
jgi:hypothetical protein